MTGGSHAELPMIQAAKKRGDYVITTGSNTEGIGHRYADLYIPGDFSNREFVCHLAEIQNVDAIVSGCNDFAYLSTAYACDQLNLPGHDSLATAKLIHHKNEFRQTIKKLGIRTPKVVACSPGDDVTRACMGLRFPILVKPVDLTGGKGVTVCERAEDLQAAFDAACKITRESVVILEEFIKGTNHGASVLLKNERIIFGFIDNEQYYLNPYLVSGACYPSSVPQETIGQLYTDIECLAADLHLADGLFHVQFIVDETGHAVMIDPCRRAPGDLYVSLVQYATEVDYPLAILKAECGEELPDHYTVIPHNIARECIMTDHNGYVDSIWIDPEVQTCIMKQMIWGQKGDRIEDYKKYKAGILFIEESDAEKLYRKVQAFHEYVGIRVKSFA